MCLLCGVPVSLCSRMFGGFFLVFLIFLSSCHVVYNTLVNKSNVYHHIISSHMTFGAILISPLAVFSVLDIMIE